MWSSIPLEAFAEPVLFAAFLIGMRMLGVVLALPGLAAGAFPAPTRMLFVTFLTVFCYTALGMPIVAVPGDVFSAAVMIVRELLLGAALGFVVRMLFAIADVSGSIAGMAMSLSMAGMVDPSTGEQTTAVSNLLGLGGMLLFVALGGHQEAVKGLVANLSLFPIGKLALVTFDQAALAEFGRGLFAASLQIAAPIIIVTTLINVGLGLMARAAPQVNIFAVGFSILLCAGIVLLDTTVFALRQTFEDQIPTLAEEMNAHLSILDPGGAP